MSAIVGLSKLLGVKATSGGGDEKDAIKGLFKELKPGKTALYDPNDGAMIGTTSPPYRTAVHLSHVERFDRRFCVTPIP